ncbi:MAG: hypothetical protein QF749_11575, partial [Verrucomicrobiota bacterium]|nr:hypothetical protein [Verrucomicrobiota bacterium]
TRSFASSNRIVWPSIFKTLSMALPERVAVVQQFPVAGAHRIAFFAPTSEEGSRFLDLFWGFQNRTEGQTDDGRMMLSMVIARMM